LYFFSGADAVLRPAGEAAWAGIAVIAATGMDEVYEEGLRGQAMRLMSDGDESSGSSRRPSARRL
jgi:hypothetical protein